MWNWLQIYRVFCLGSAAFGGLIVAALSAHITAYAEEKFQAYYTFGALGIATGAVTFFSLTAMLIVDFLRRGAFTSWVVVELIWTFVLWVLMIATAAVAVNNTIAFFASCNFVYDWLNGLCRETQAIEAFAFLSWLALSSYNCTLLVVSLIAANRGKPFWKGTVRDYNSLPPSQFAYNPNAFAPQIQQQQPLMAPGQPMPMQGGFYQQPYQTGSGYQPQQQVPMPTGGSGYQQPVPTGGSYPPPQPVPSPVSGMSHGQQYTPPQQQAYGQTGYPQV